MTQNEKDLLLKDLCARLPYFTKVQIKNEIVLLDSICDDDGYHFNFIGDNREGVNIEQIKPYLFPLSNMTDEQKKEYCSLVWFDGLSAGWNRDDAVILNEVEMLIDFYYKNHLDWRGLIPKGLAIDATGLNIY